jgi:DDE superfamily endonuclease
VIGRHAGGTGRRRDHQGGVCPHHAQKNALKPWPQHQGVIPPQANAEFVWAMEDVLEVYTRPDDPKRPQVCGAETSTPLVAETRGPIPATPGQPVRIDYEYERQGTAKLCMVFEPLAGQRRVKVTERRTAVDFAHLLREVVDPQYPHAEKSGLVMDNLNTPKPASLYEAYTPAEARRLLERLELHHTPKHGSWLNMAETELSVLAAQGVNRRLPDPAILTQEVAAWERQRNTAQCRVDWRFTTHDARIKLKRLYPAIQLG